MCRCIMASLKRKVGMTSGSFIDLTGDEPNDIVLADSVLELYLGSDIRPNKINKLDLLIREHYVAGLVALERGDVENFLHF